MTSSILTLKYINTNSDVDKQHRATAQSLRRSSYLDSTLRLMRGVLKKKKTYREKYRIVIIWNGSPKLDTENF